MSSEERLVLEDIVDDLIRILATVERQCSQTGGSSYESVQQEVSDQLGLHLLSYVRFLEADGLLTYDRISDEMRVTEPGQQALSAPHMLHAGAREAFGEHLVEAEAVEPPDVSSGFSDMFDDMAAEMDSVLSGAATPESDPGTFAGAAPVSEAEAFEATFEPAPQEEHWDVASALDTSLEEPSQQAPVFDAPVSEASKEAFQPEEDSVIDNPANAPVSNSGWSASAHEGSMQENAFERIEEIGSGGIGTVYRGRQVRLNREVAIKEVREIFSVFAGVQRDDILERFRTIIQTQASLNHPNIIQLVDVDTSGEFPYAVMQWAPNGNLRRLIDHGDRPPLKVALKYFLQILHALNTAHDQGVVHGSLKPENVVLDHAGNAMVTDFGISRIVEREGGRGNQVYVGVGTVAYMSPEQFQDPNVATVKSDIYSMGIMVYEMLTGKVPGRRSPMPSSFFPDIPRALDDIFDRMSMDREEDRYDSIDEIIADVYASEEVLAILDKRSGVLFLRDPITYGETGLGDNETALASSAGLAADSEVDSEPDWENEESSVAEDSGFEGAEEGALAEATGADDVFEEGESSEAGAAASEADAELDDSEEELEVEGDVLDKLNKYGELFEED